VWNHPEVIVVLSGMNEEAHIEENLRIAENGHALSLTGEELALVEKVSLRYRELMKVPCTGCGYCMPCPSGVLIPGCFEAFNKMHMFGEVEGVKFSYALRMSGMLADGEPRYASQCIECGECLEKCPQQIPIPEFLADIAAEMEDQGLEKRLSIARKMFKEEK
jgi:predicted aldo/keto reductase-like oxidoreductase